jgi:hypothetical protein
MDGSPTATLGQPCLAGCLFHFAEFAQKRGCTEIGLSGAELCAYIEDPTAPPVMTEQQPKTITIAWHILSPMDV